MELSGRVLTPGWSNAYVDPPVPFLAGGRDRRGWDCWGLLRVVYAEQFGVELPALAGEYASASDPEPLAPIVARERVNWREVESPRAGDAVLAAILGHECHVGVYVEPASMLHVLEAAGTRVERIDTHAWNRRIRGYFRPS